MYINFVLFVLSVLILCKWIQYCVLYSEHIKYILLQLFGPLRCF